MNIAVKPAGKVEISPNRKPVVENGVWLYKMINSIKNKFCKEIIIFIFKNSLGIFKNITQFQAQTAKLYHNFSSISCGLIGIHEVYKIHEKIGLCY